ncbi:olfactory receptor 1G1-like [Xenopus tropicalis]|uniref:Olfactory receptor 1G1-like n=1 Tax=Xenopus tropicalis TaxID=8364 RepID=A0A8J0R8J4_XENTR|nr:olfactory receptor 1G1-like [Xenopus tropicalis]|eukprot:XP_004919816.1 PREDICTED: olfactory receptor 1G1-like [Xenopus tropicalis]
MEKENSSTVTEFILLGLSENPEQKSPLSALFLTIYLVTVLGNSLILSLIFMTPELQTPMYFFLGNLSFVDSSFISVTVPLMVAHLLMEKKSISFQGCMTQLFFFFLTATMECLVLAIMAYDRLIAISNPLRYLSIINRRTCLCLMGSSWVLSSLHSTLHTSIISSLDYCGANKINEHFCDLPPLVALSCSSTTGYDILVLTEGSLLAMSPFIFVVISYFHILKTILNINSSSRRYQAFSTCSSHLTSVGLYFGAIFFTYFYPSSSGSESEERPLSVVYSILTPLLNPFIYSLRNQQVKRALKKVTHQRLFHQKGM